MAKNENLDVIVVVSGQSTTIRVNPHQSVEQLVKEALKESGNKGQPPDQWELRTADGTLVDQGLNIGSAGIVSGTTLFLSPRAGVGG